MTERTLSDDSPQLRDLDLPAALRAGAVGGAAAWAVYAVAECLFSSVVPWVTQPSYAYTPVHRGFTALLFVLYPLVGAAAGALLSAVLRATAGAVGFPRTAAPVAGMLTVVLAFDLNLLHLIFISPFSFEASTLHLIQPLAVSTLPLAAGIAALASDAWRLRLRFLTSPWTAGLLLTGLPWLTVHGLSTATRGAKTAGVVLFPVVIVVLAFLVHRLLGAPPRRARFAAVAAGTLTLVASLVADHTAQVLAPMPDAPAGPARPNVVLIIMDTVRAQHTSLYGYERSTTPHLEELAEHATLYRRCIASGDMTLTTHASIFTGLYGRTHGAHRSPMTPAGRPLADGFLTMAEILSASDYWTAAVVANRGYVTPHFGFDQGFHYFDSRGPVPFLGLQPPYYVRRGVRAMLVPFAPRAAFDRVVRSAESINSSALELLGQAKERGGPFLLFVNYMDAHNPFIPPAPFDTMFPGKDDSFTSVRYGRLLWELNRQGRRSLTERERDHLVSQYDGGIAYIDDQIAVLVDRLKELGLYDDTLLLISADHGEALGERDLLNHGVSVYQDQVFVPLLIKYPGQTEGATVNTWTSSVDVLPSVLAVVGEPTPEGLPGISLRNVDPDLERAVVSESFPTGSRARFNRMERAYFAGPNKLIRNTDGKREIYDLVHDGFETKNLFGDDDLSRGMERRLDEWLEATEVRTDSTTVDLDADMRERLKALGYVD